MNSNNTLFAFLTKLTRLDHGNVVVQRLPLNLHAILGRFDSNPFTGVLERLS